MKRSFVFFCALVAGALSFSSCNKNLKDDINELRNQLGTDEPITATTTFTDRNNVERKLTTTYKFKGSAGYSNALIKNSDGIYEIRIRRFETIDGESGVRLDLVYDPATKKVLYKQAVHYWEDYTSNGEVNVEQGEDPTAGLTFNVDIKNLDLNSGNISVDVKIEGSKEYSQNNEWDVPNRNSAFTTSFSFNGKLKIFEDTLPR